jgi:hypothetical protein
LLSFEEPLNTSDSQPASLAPIGSNTNAEMMAQRRGQMPKRTLANLLTDDGNPNSTPGVIAVHAL